MNLKRYIVTAVDVGESCDGHARVLGCFNAEADAKNYVRNDIEDICDRLAGAEVRADFDQMEIVNKDEDTVCCWSIDEVEVEIEDADIIDFHDKAYNEGYDKGYEDGVDDHIQNS